MNDSLIQYFRCPEHYVRLAVKGLLSAREGYFRFGEGTFCYGRCSGRDPSAFAEEALYDAYLDAGVEKEVVSLPFNLTEVIANLRSERYIDGHRKQSIVHSVMVQVYYLLRPFLPVAVRKHLQRVRLSRWQEISLPHWPVDRSVDKIFERVFLLSLRAQHVDKIPFIWFWPGGASSCAIMTHDVETARGRDFCTTLMDIDDSFGIKSSFQVVPEVRYEVTPEYLDSLTSRGFEVVVQDLNHDGHLYRNRELFATRAAKINSYAQKWRAEGFRAAVLYRRQEWFDELELSYDMSVPNVAHLDPQRGGCCTVMPYFVGKVLELPVTTTQDYSLFHILQDYSIELWKSQIDLITEKHGLMNFIVHPDYITTSRERKTYETLLSHLASLKEDTGVWVATPGEVNQWWRQRAKMHIVEDSNGVRIEGAGKERARIAYASEKDGQLVYTLDSAGSDHVFLGQNCGKHVED